MLKAFLRNLPSHPVLDNEVEANKYVDDVIDFIITEFERHMLGNEKNILDIQCSIIKKRYEIMMINVIDDNFRGAFSIGVKGNRLKTPDDIKNEIIIKVSPDHLLNGLAILMLNHELPLSIKRWKDLIYNRVDYCFLNNENALVSLDDIIELRNSESNEGLKNNFILWIFNNFYEEYRGYDEDEKASLCSSKSWRDMVEGMDRYRLNSDYFFDLLEFSDNGSSKIEFSDFKFNILDKRL